MARTLTQGSAAKRRCTLGYSLPALRAFGWGAGSLCNTGSIGRREIEAPDCAHPVGRALKARATAFTLIELILVIVLIGGISAIVVSTFVGRSAGAERRRAAGELIAALATARVDAMRSGVAVAAEARCADGTLRFSVGDRVTKWPARGLVIADLKDRPLDPARVRFQPSGRCDAQGWALLVSDAAPGAAAGRMWRVEFDPVSGAASLRREGDPPKVGVVEEVVR